jgi:hypothetical protein
MDVKSPSAQNIVLLSLALDKDNLLKEELKTATNIGNFLEISKKHGYEIDHTKLEYVNLFFEQEIESMSRLTRVTEVLNVKILRIVSKLCIGIGDTKFDQLMTLFSIDNGFYLGKTQRL